MKDGKAMKRKKGEEKERKKLRGTIVEALGKAWRQGKIRKELRKATGATDAQIEAELLSEEVVEGIGRMLRCMVEEAKLAVLDKQIERAMAEAASAKQFAELADYNGTLRNGPGKEGEAEAELTAFESAMVEGLREALRAGARKEEIENADERR